MVMVGERTPILDYAILTGTPTKEWSVDTLDQTNTMLMNSGDSVVELNFRAGTYLTAADTAVAFKWVIQARGAGTLTLYDDQDPAWNYTLPGNALGSIIVAGDAFYEQLVPTTHLTLAGFLSNGSQRLGVACTGGNVEVNLIALQAEPPGGIGGAWGPTVALSNVTIPVQGSKQFEKIGFTAPVQYGTASGWNAAVASAYADWHSGTVTALAGGALVTAEDGSTFWGASSDTTATWRAPNPIDDGVSSLIFGSYGLEVVAAPGASQLYPQPAGAVDGSNYWRRPDRTLLEPDAYAQHVGTPPALLSWINGVTVVRREKIGPGANVPDSTMVVHEGDSFPQGAWPPQGTAVPAPAGGLLASSVLSYDPFAGTDVAVKYPFTPSHATGRFTVWEHSSLFTSNPNRFDGYVTSSVWLGDVTVIFTPGQPYRITSAKPLSAVWSLGSVQYWDPYATAGGVWPFRLRMDSDWRDVGRESRVGAGRMKLWTGTKWVVEYNASDGAPGVLRPLKMWDGTRWRVVARMKDV